MDRGCRPFKRHWEKIDTFGDVYSPRTGHAVVTHEDSCYVFGGTDSEKRQNDLHCFNLVTKRWLLVEPKSSKRPPKRSGAKAIVYEDKMYIFGGYDGRGGNYFSDLYYFDFRESIWFLVNDNPYSGSKVPSPRTDHTMVLYKNQIIVFGGFDGHCRLNDIFSFDLKTCTWRQIEPESNIMPKPCVRFAHSASVYMDEMFVFGGWNGLLTLNSLWKFSFVSNQWQLIFIGNEIEEQSRSPPSSKQIPNWPAHRYRHTSVISNNTMFIFGGVDKNHNRFNDLQAYDLRANRWVELNGFGIMPDARTFHPAVVHEKYMYVFGGYDGESRLNDVFRIYLGKLALVPLEILATDALRYGCKKNKMLMTEIQTSLSLEIFSKRDFAGVLRGGIRQSSPKKTIICHMFSPKTAFDVESDTLKVLDAPCQSCGLDSCEHDKIADLSKSRLANLAAMRSIFQKHLNIYSEKETKNQISKKLFSPAAIQCALAPLSENQLNIKRTIFGRGRVKKDKSSKSDNLGNSSSPTTNEPEGRRNSNSVTTASIPFDSSGVVKNKKRRTGS